MVENRVCQNCSYFFLDNQDYESNLGICSGDKTFEPYFDIIMKESSFACCHDLYLEKRYTGEKPACSEFEKLEIIEEEEDVFGIVIKDASKHKNMDEMIEQLYNSDNKQLKKTITSLDSYIHNENNQA